MLQESLAVSQLPKQSARLPSARADSKEDVKLTGKPVSVESELVTCEPFLEFTSQLIFVGGIPMTMTEDKLRAVLGAKFEATIIERYHEKAQVGHAKVRILEGRFSDDELDQGLELESPVTGQRLRIAKWQSSKSPAPAVARANKARRERKSEKQAHRRHHVKSKVPAMKEQAMFVAEFLHAQAVPNARRLYSQVASTTEARMKSIETTMHDMKQMLKRLMKDGV